MSRTHRVVIVSAIFPVAAGLALLAGMVLTAQSEGEHEIPKDLGKSLPVVAPDKSVVATVNGVEIHRDELDSAQTLAAAGGQPSGTSEILDQLIGNQLLVQEGKRRGLIPTDDETEAQLKLVRESTAAELVQAVIDNAKKYGYSWTVDEYWDLPQHRQTYRDSITANRALQALQKEAGGPQNSDPELIIGRLKSSARIERFVD